MSVYEDCFQRYKDHSPTAFDNNINIDDNETCRQGWFVMPVSQTRDSGPLDQSNFQQFLEGLGGESETVEVHRFGHWGPGWYEIIIVNPDDETAMAAAYDMARSLEDYPVLNEEDWSSREWDDFCESWDNWACREFCKAIVGYYGLSDAADSMLECVDGDELRGLWMEVANEPYFSESSGVSVRFDSCSLDRIGRDRIAQLLWSARRSA